MALSTWLVVLALPATVKADAISIKTVTTVPAGQQPKLTIVANQAVEKVEIMLNRDDGKLVSEAIAALAAGSSREVMLDGAAGKRKYSGRISCMVEGKSISTSVDFETFVSAQVNITVDKSRVDLAAGRMEVMVSIPDGKVELKIISASDGAVLVEHEQSFEDHPVDKPLVVKWEVPAKPVDIGRVDVRVSDANDAFGSFSLYPWSVYIPHEEVVFATDSAAIAATELPKLQASLGKIADALAKHSDLGPIKLYIAGHTDTVGKAQYNLALSRRRAEAIAGWFRKNGLHLPIAFEGFGEQALRIATPDNTDEPRNRRVDYILSIEDPVLRATDFRPVWKPVN